MFGYRHFIYLFAFLYLVWWMNLDSIDSLLNSDAAMKIYVSIYDLIGIVIMYYIMIVVMLPFWMYALIDVEN